MLLRYVKINNKVKFVCMKYHLNKPDAYPQMPHFWSQLTFITTVNIRHILVYMYCTQYGGKKLNLARSKLHTDMQRDTIWSSNFDLTGACISAFTLLTLNYSIRIPFPTACSLFRLSWVQIQIYVFLCKWEMNIFSKKSVQIIQNHITYKNTKLKF